MCVCVCVCVCAIVSSMAGRAQFDCKEKVLAWARDRFMNGLSDRQWKSKFTKYLLDTHSCKFPLQSASNEDGPTMEEFCRVFTIFFSRGTSQASRPVLAEKLCAMIETSLKRQPRLEPSASIVGAESIPQPLLDNVLHDGRDSGQQARQRKPMQSPPRKRLRLDRGVLSPDRSQPRSSKDAPMESQASA